jgi:hypothetical protein
MQGTEFKLQYCPPQKKKEGRKEGRKKKHILSWHFHWDRSWRHAAFLRR